MKSEPFDIVNSHYSPDFFVAGAAARICKVPNYVITRHLAIPWPKQKGRLLAQFATQFVAVSGAVEEALARSGIPSERIEMIWVGIDEQPLTMTREQARDSMGIEPDEIAIGFVGRLIKEKGPDVLLAVAKETERRIHVIGDGEYAKVFQQKVAYEGASNLIRMHGYRSDIGNVLNAFDVFLAPSLWDDAFPAAVIEAMYFSKPIIASKVGGIPEMLDFGSAGLLVEPRDIKSWAAQLERLIGSSSVRSEYGERAKARQVQNYSRQTMARTYEKLYLRLQDR